MTAQMPSPQCIDKYIREEMAALLHANQIYTLDSYGWVDADTYDPELVGHAMRQHDSLSWRFLLAAMDSSSPPPLEPWEKFLVQSGGDFDGLMEMARLSIGLMLFQDASVREDATARDSFFALHLTAVMLLLASASDRLRDFFISTIFHKFTERRKGSPFYEKGKFNTADRSMYVTPFNEALDELAGCPEAIGSSVVALPDLAARIEKLRLIRNRIVHVIATEQGQLNQRLVNDPPTPDSALADFDITDEMLEEAKKTAKAEHDERISIPMRWYQLLIEASNHVFIIENTRRVWPRAYP